MDAVLRTPSVTQLHSAPRATGVVCRTCGRAYPIDYTVCPRDGASLGVIGREDPLLGSVVAGSYRVVRCLARGGMGRLYEVEQVRLGKTVTLKVLHDHLASNPELVARFEREARAASRIDSPHVVEVLDVVRTPCGRPAIVAEHLAGRDLQRALDTVERPPLEDALAWSAGVALGLAAAHAVGVVHRDVKPANVFLVESRTGVVPKVLDFGVAKLADEEMLTQSGTVVGTPAYMAPEQAKNAALADARSDVYSVGALLHRLVTGTTPYEPGDAATTLARILTDEPRRPRALADDVPLAVEAIIQRAMARDPDLRFESMHELASAIEAVRCELFSESSDGGRVVRRLTRQSERARPLALMSMVVAAIATSAAAATIAGSVVTRPDAPESRLLAGLAALVAGAGIAVPLAERLREAWRSAPAVLSRTKSIASVTFVGLAACGLVDLLVRASGAIVGRAGSTGSLASLVFGAIAATAVALRHATRAANDA